MDSGNEAKTPERAETDSAFSKRTTLLLLALIVALYVLFRLWRLTASCLWFDEIFSVHAGRHNWPGLIHFVAADIIHPPLFYALLKVWISIGGESLLWLRLFPALIAIAAMVPFFLLCRELGIERGAMTLALLLMAVNGYLIKYAQELRMYSLLFFLSLCSLWLFATFLRAEAFQKKNLLALFAINLLLVYTHYSGWLLVSIEVVAVLIWNRARWRSFVGCWMMTVLAYAPWIYEVRKVSATYASKGLAQNIGWVTRPHLLDVLQYFMLLTKPFLYRQSTAELSYDPSNTFLAVVLIGLPLAAFTWQIFRRSTKEDATHIQPIRLLFLLVFAPATVIFLLSWIFPYSIWGTRHLIIAAGPFSILVTLAFRRLTSYWLKTTLYLLLSCWFVVAGMAFVLSRPPGFIWCTWEPLAQQMTSVDADSAHDGPAEVYAYEDLVAYHLWFVLDTDKRFKISVIKGVPGIFEDPAYFLPRDFAGVTVTDSAAPRGNHIWIAFRGKQWDEKTPPLDSLVNSGYHIERVLEQAAQGQKAFLMELRRE